LIAIDRSTRLDSTRLDSTRFDSGGGEEVSTSVATRERVERLRRWRPAPRRGASSKVRESRTFRDPRALRKRARLLTCINGTESGAGSVNAGSSLATLDRTSTRWISRFDERRASLRMIASSMIAVGTVAPRASPLPSAANASFFSLVESRRIDSPTRRGSRRDPYKEAMLAVMTVMVSLAYL